MDEIDFETRAWVAVIGLMSALLFVASVKIVGALLMLTVGKI
ncbi:hypothetical protein ACTX90_02435 [Glutamicibacter soli]